MEITSLTSKNQATIPLEVRQFLGLKGGDKVVFEIDKKKNEVKIHKAQKNLSEEDYFLYKLQEKVLAEDWLSPEDEKAFKDW